MEALILVPGIEGSRLSLAGTEIWPPTVPEYVFGYPHIAELRNTHTIATGVIDAVSCVQVYKPIMDDLDKIAASLGGTHVDAFYDWRKDLLSFSTGVLAQTVDRSVKAGATSVTLVCHSMGGLVGRLLLESGKYNTATWFNKINKFVGICTPNVGAPVAVAEALGLEGSNGISPTDARTLCGDPNYPAAYQCFPAPGYDVLWDASGGTATPVDIYSTAGATKFGLTQSNIKAALNSWSHLHLSRPPRGVQYFLFGGQNYSTDEKFIYNGGTSWDSETDASGDGTVPVWSSLAGPVTHYSFVGDHLGILKVYAFRQKLYEVLGATIMPTVYISDRSGVAITINKMVFAPAEMVEILIVPDFPTSEINGKLAIARANNVLGTEFVPYDGGISIEYKGPVVKFLPLQISAPSAPGAYKISFIGPTHASAAATGAGFAVTTKSRANPIIVSQRTAPVAGRKRSKQKAKRK
jgi:hypothetical protein